jgi:hypothetical protein
VGEVSKRREGEWKEEGRGRRKEEAMREVRRKEGRRSEGGKEEQVRRREGTGG